MYDVSKGIYGKRSGFLVGWEKGVLARAARSMRGVHRTQFGGSRREPETTQAAGRRGHGPHSPEPSPST